MHASICFPFLALTYIFIGSSVFKALTGLVATLLVLKVLTESFPGKFVIEIQARISITIVDHTFQYIEGVKKAVSFAASTDKSYPSLCARLELGYSWQSAIEDIVSTAA